MRFSRILIILVSAFLSGTPLPARAQSEEMPDEFIIVSKAPSQVPVAIPDFLPKYSDPSARELSVKLAQVLREDLDASGLFQVIPQENYLQSFPFDDGKEDFQAWTMIGAEACARGLFDRKGEDFFQIELRFYDVAARRLVLGKRYTGSIKSLRRMIHRFADEILDWLTGERGSFETSIAFVSNRSGRKEIYIMDSDGEDLNPLTSNRTLNLSPEWLDTRSVFYTSYKNVYPQLYLKQVAEGRDIQVTRKTRFNLGAAVSPNGKKIALAMKNKGGNIDIYLMNPNGTDLRRVTTSEAIDLSPAWSPDSRFMAFVSDRTGSPQIYLLNLVAGSEGPRNRSVRLTREGSYNTSPAWSPDGKRIAFSGRRDSQFDLFFINLDQDEPKTATRLTDTVWNEEDPAWSPDGRMLVYCANQRGNYDVYTRSVFAGKTRRLTDAPSYDGAPAWSPSLRPAGP